MIVSYICKVLKNPQKQLLINKLEKSCRIQHQQIFTFLYIINKQSKKRKFRKEFRLLICIKKNKILGYNFRKESIKLVHQNPQNTDEINLKTLK